jgi:hypothetical protein
VPATGTNETTMMGGITKHSEHQNAISGFEVSGKDQQI